MTLPSRVEIRDRERWYTRSDMDPVLNAYASEELMTYNEWRKADRAHLRRWYNANLDLEGR